MSMPTEIVPIVAPFSTTRLFRQTMYRSSPDLVRIGFSNSTGSPPLVNRSNSDQTWG